MVPQDGRTGDKAVNVMLVAELGKVPLVIVKRPVGKVQLPDSKNKKGGILLHAKRVCSVYYFLHIVRIGVVYEKAYSFGANVHFH